MISKRDKIRWFIKEVHWAVPMNVAYFIEDKYDKAIQKAYSSELSEMRREKDRSLRLKIVRNQDGRNAYTMSSKHLPTYLFNHDVCLRNVIGKFLHDRGHYNVSLEKPADASILHYRFELDNGHMDEKQLEDKLITHYYNINCQVVFIMRHREFPHLEVKRLNKVFAVSEKIFPNKPNKVLGACYTRFLENGLIYNRKGKTIA